MKIVEKIELTPAVKLSKLKRGDVFATVSCPTIFFMLLPCTVTADKGIFNCYDLKNNRYDYCNYEASVVEYDATLTMERKKQ